MKLLTLERFESLWEEVLIRPKDIYQEILPYLKDEEEERHIQKVYVVIEVYNKTILGCFESSEDAYKYADSSRLAVQLLIVEPSKQRTKQVEGTPKGETVQEQTKPEWVNGEEYLRSRSKPKGETVEEFNERIRKHIESVNVPTVMIADKREQFWRDVWVSVASAINCCDPETATKWANKALEAYDELIKQSKP
jgi:hypothetical protein